MEDLTRVAHNIPFISLRLKLLHINSNCAIILHHHVRKCPQVSGIHLLSKLNGNLMGMIFRIDLFIK